MTKLTKASHKKKTNKNQEKYRQPKKTNNKQNENTNIKTKCGKTRKTNKK